MNLVPVPDEDWHPSGTARLYEVGFAEIRLLVSRPPATLEAALPIAAEHTAFCDECGRMGLRHVNMLADTLGGTASGTSGGTSRTWPRSAR